MEIPRRPDIDLNMRCNQLLAEGSPPTSKLSQIRSKLAGYHFAKECLSKGERELLAIAEALMAVSTELSIELSTEEKIVSKTIQYNYDAASDEFVDYCARLLGSREEIDNLTGNRVHVIPGDHPSDPMRYKVEIDDFGYVIAAFNRLMQRLVPTFIFPETVDAEALDALRSERESAMEAEISAITSEYDLTHPKDCEGLKESHLSAVVEISGCLMTLDGPYSTVMKAINAVRVDSAVIGIYGKAIK